MPPRRVLRSAGRVVVVAAAAFLTSPTPAWALDCTEITDCLGNTARGSLSALVGVGMLSLLLFAPEIGVPLFVARGLVEGGTGYDVVTGEPLDWKMRALGLLPVAGEVAGELKAVVQLERTAVELTEAERTVIEMAKLERAGAEAAEGVAGLSAGESSIIGQGQSVFGSSEFGALRAANAAGTATEVRIGGTTILYEPSLPASGMTLFGENGFLLGPEAFATESELSQTVLHELYRLGTSESAGGLGGALANSETNDAAAFAARYYHLLLGGG